MIARFLSSEELLKDPRNHTVPILDVFKKDDESLTFMIMPFLNAFDKPMFSSVDEVIDFMRQTLQVRRVALFLMLPSDYQEGSVVFA